MKHAPARRRPAPPRSARDRAKAETREALVQAALAEFAAHGLDAPSLDAICARAGFTRGAFYVHFRDRDELVVAVMDRAFGAFLDAIVPSGTEPRDLERTVRRYADATIGLLQLRERTGRAGAPGAAGVPLHRILEACARAPALRARFVALLGQAAERVARTAAAGQRGGAVRSDVPPAAIGSLLVAIALGYLATIDAGAPVDAPAARDAVLALLAPS
ncbi:MAG: TetR family transcriptional regulator [Deltaproteobacteria bacterium]|nr:TetR family transcriptional regulator [Deltaproteobacteria bacterium]